MDRPKNWNEIVRQSSYGWNSRDAFEAGADAMLEMLRGAGVFTYGHHTPDIKLDDAKEESGYWVFIPDEVEQ